MNLFLAITAITVLLLGINLVSRQLAAIKLLAFVLLVGLSVDTGMMG